jgi:hypothetical protein
MCLADLCASRHRSLANGEWRFLSNAKYGVSKNLRTRGQEDTDSWYGLFDT